MPGPTSPITAAGGSMSSETKYLFIGGPWDGRREHVAPEKPTTILHDPIGGPPRTYMVTWSESRPVSYGENWRRDIQDSAVQIKQVLYRREILHGSGSLLFVFVHGEIDVLTALIARYPLPMPPASLI